MMSAEMPAAVINRHASPPEHVLWPMPRRGHGQALVRVTAAPISPLDLLCASGTSYFGAPRLPYIPGVQGIGIVMEADILMPGQRIWFSCDAGMKPGDGSMALYCVIDESSALVLPDQVDDDLAAALGLSAIAAWMALTWRGHLQPGEQVLVLGASGALSRPRVTRLLVSARSYKAQTLLSTSRATMWTRSVNALRLPVKVPCTSSSTLCGVCQQKLPFECWLLRGGWLT